MFSVCSTFNNPGLRIPVISGCQTYNAPVSPEKDAIRPQLSPNQRWIFRIVLLNTINRALKSLIKTVPVNSLALVLLI